MTEYAVKAYPTEYRGRTYRSRLEARWAAFFDLLGWRHEYEPFDLGKWSPDFLLTDMNVLVEVKPITEFDEKTAKKMTEASWNPTVGTKDSGLNAVLLIGVAPRVIKHGVMLGWQGTFWVNPHRCEWSETPLYWTLNLERPEIRPDLLCVGNNGWNSLSTEMCGPLESLVSRTYPDHTMELWALATGLVQWRPE